MLSSLSKGRITSHYFSSLSLLLFNLYLNSVPPSLDIFHTTTLCTKYQKTTTLDNNKLQLMYNSHLTTNLIIYLHLVKILHKVLLSLCSVILDYHSELNLFVNTMPQTQVNHQFQGTNLIFICIFLRKYFNFLH